jgi:hypothetical protein
MLKLQVIHRTLRGKLMVDSYPHLMDWIYIQCKFFNSFNHKPGSFLLDLSTFNQKNRVYIHSHFDECLNPQSGMFLLLLL